MTNCSIEFVSDQNRNIDIIEFKNHHFCNCAQNKNLCGTPVFFCPKISKLIDALEKNKIFGTPVSV